MNKILFVLFLLAAKFIYCQKNPDNPIQKYISEYEKRTLEDSILKQDSNVGYMDLLFSLDSTYTLEKTAQRKSDIDDFLQSLKGKVDRYNEKKKVKYLFEKVHDEFFVKYDIEAYFSDIFKSSTYNCVTGSALYAYAFDFFKIPYQIKETPTHVFLVVYPKRFNIYIETTVPGKVGSYVPSESFFKKAVDELVEMKLVTQQELSEKGYIKTFNEHYYGDGNITKRELAALQYYNKAVSSVNGNRYEEAYQNILKSSLLYENERSKLFTNGLLSLVVEEMDFRTIENFQWYLELVKNEEDIDYLKYKLANILSEDTWTEKEFDYVENILVSHAIEEHNKKEIMEVLYEKRAERYAKLQLQKKALIYAEKIYELNPNHLTAKNYIAEFQINTLANKNLNEERLSDLNLLTEKYPFLTDFGIYSRYKVYLYSFLTANSFEKNVLKQGNEYLKELEKLLDDNSDEIGLNEEAIGNAYASVGAYYYRQKRVSKSVEVLKRGLQYSPGNSNITRKLKLIKNAN